MQTNILLKSGLTKSNFLFVISSNANIYTDKYVSYISTCSLSLSLAQRCVTTDALMMREKVGISFAQLIPEVSNRKRENRERRVKRAQGQKPK